MLRVVCDMWEHVCVAPLSTLRVSSSIGHASDPYVNTKQHVVIYSLSLSLSFRCFDAHMCPRLPSLTLVNVILLGMWAPPAWEIDTRYLNCQWFVSDLLSQCTFDIVFDISSSLSHFIYFFRRMGPAFIQLVFFPSQMTPKVSFFHTLAFPSIYTTHVFAFFVVVEIKRWIPPWDQTKLFYAQTTVISK